MAPPVCDEFCELQKSIHAAEKRIEDFKASRKMRKEAAALEKRVSQGAGAGRKRQGAGRSRQWGQEEEEGVLKGCCGCVAVRLCACAEWSWAPRRMLSGMLDRLHVCVCVLASQCRCPPCLHPALADDSCAPASAGRQDRAPAPAP
eukprot:1964988-Rhodomonas_salina.1